MENLWTPGLDLSPLGTCNSIGILKHRYNVYIIMIDNLFCQTPHDKFLVAPLLNNMGRCMKLSNFFFILYKL